MSHWMGGGEIQKYGAAARRNTKNALRGPRVCGRDASRYLSYPELVYRLAPVYHPWLGDHDHGPVVGCNQVDNGRPKYADPACCEIFRRCGHPSNL